MLLGDCDLKMTVKVKPDHRRDWAKTCLTFCVKLQTNRVTDNETNRRNRVSFALTGIMSIGPTLVKSANQTSNVTRQGSPNPFVSASKIETKLRQDYCTPLSTGVAPLAKDCRRYWGHGTASRVIFRSSNSPSSLRLAFDRRRAYGRVRCDFGRSVAGGRQHSSAGLGHLSYTWLRHAGWLDTG